MLVVMQIPYLSGKCVATTNVNSLCEYTPGNIRAVLQWALLWPISTERLLTETSKYDTQFMHLGCGRAPKLRMKQIKLRVFQLANGKLAQHKHGGIN